jgi:hypothetical protein
MLGRPISPLPGSRLGAMSPSPAAGMLRQPSDGILAGAFAANNVPGSQRNEAHFYSRHSDESSNAGAQQKRSLRKVGYEHASSRSSWKVSDTDYVDASSTPGSARMGSSATGARRGSSCSGTAEGLQPVGLMTADGKLAGAGSAAPRSRGVAQSHFFEPSSRRPSTSGDQGAGHAKTMRHVGYDHSAAKNGFKVADMYHPEENHGAPHVPRPLKTDLPPSGELMQHNSRMAHYDRLGSKEHLSKADKPASSQLRQMNDKAQLYGFERGGSGKHADGQRLRSDCMQGVLRHDQRPNRRRSANLEVPADLAGKASTNTEPLCTSERRHRGGAGVSRSSSVEPRRPGFNERDAGGCPMVANSGDAILGCRFRVAPGEASEAPSQQRRTRPAECSTPLSARSACSERSDYGPSDRRAGSIAASSDCGSSRSHSVDHMRSADIRGYYGQQSCARSEFSEQPSSSRGGSNIVPLSARSLHSLQSSFGSVAGTSDCGTARSALRADNQWDQRSNAGSELFETRSICSARSGRLDRGGMSHRQPCSDVDSSRGGSIVGPLVPDSGVWEQRSIAGSESSCGQRSMRSLRSSNRLLYPPSEAPSGMTSRASLGGKDKLRPEGHGAGMARRGSTSKSSAASFISQSTMMSRTSRASSGACTPSRPRGDMSCATSTTSQGTASRVASKSLIEVRVPQPQLLAPEMRGERCYPGRGDRN